MPRYHYTSQPIKRYRLIGGVILSLLATDAAADLIPTADSPWYYKLGGGQSVANPAHRSSHTIPLRVEVDVGSGYNCGLFNPRLSITHSLNSITHSFQAIQQSMIEHATSAVTQLPMYAISRADPALYHLLNNALLGAREDLNISMKSCQKMESDIAKGKNPYQDWMTVSLGNDWQYHMSLANQDKNSESADINQAKTNVEQANGDQGIPWVQGVPARHGFYAGGKGQPPILVLHDTAIAGYNVILQMNRDYADVRAPRRTTDNQHLVDTWATPTLAAQWITTVLGDEKITTVATGEKSSSPGVGLLPDNQALTQIVLPKLQNLVAAKPPLSLAQLTEVSAPGIMLNQAVIQAIREKPPVTQAIVINKLAQEVATATLVDKAQLARQILQEGSQVPAIHGNPAAQHAIQQALAHLDHATQQLLLTAQVRKAFVSETAAQLLETQTAEQQINATQQPGKTPVLMQNGALPR